MANSKAQKTEVKFPPLLNLAKDNMHIDSSFQNFEENNSPFLNSMIQPVYVKENQFEKVYDSKGVGYYIENGHFKSDDGKVDFAVENDHFESHELEDSDNLQAYDIDSNGIEAKIEFRTDTTLTLVYNGHEQVLNRNGKIIASRVKILNGYAWLVYYADTGSGEVVFIGKMDTNGTYSNIYYSNAAWFKQKQGTIYQAFNYLEDFAPTINMAYTNGLTCISLVRQGGEVMNCRDAAFETFLINNSNTVYILGSNCSPSYAGQPDSTRTMTDSLTCSYTKGSVEKTVKTVIADVPNNVIWWYNGSATRLDQCSSAASVPMAALNGATLLGTQTLITSPATVTDPAQYTYGIYSVYQITEYSRTITYRVTGSSTLAYIPTMNVSVSYDGVNYVEGGPGTIVNGIAGQSINLYGSTNYGYGEAAIKIKWWNQSSEPTVYKINSAYVSGWRVLSQVVYGNSGDLSSYFNSGTPYNVNYNLTYGSSSSFWYPCVVVDSGMFYTMADFDTDLGTSTQNPTGWTRSYANGLPIMSGYNPVISGSTFSVTTGTTIECYDMNIPRGMSYLIGQNFFLGTYKFCNVDATSSAALAAGTSESSGSKFMEVSVSSDGGRHYGPGTTRDTTYNYYAQAAYGDPTLGGNAEDANIYVVGGHRVGESYFKLLYNVYNGGYGYLQGISFTRTGNQIGTLVTPWQSIMENTYVASNGNTCVYKDKSGKWIKIEVKPGAQLKAILDDRCIVINTTSYYNMWDSEARKKYHYASDFNARVSYGSLNYTTFKGTLKTSSTGFTAYGYIRYTGEGINPLYKVMPREICTSMLTPVQARYRCKFDGMSVLNAFTPDPMNAQSVDIFCSKQNSTVSKYAVSVNGNTRYSKPELAGLTYPVSSGTAASLNPSILADYVNGAGNNDMIVEGYDAYTLTYYDNKPTLIYSAATQVSSFYDKASKFFVIQGQFYGVMNRKLYSLLYSNGSISQMDAIIDLGDMQFVGNNPMIAFFYDPATKCLRTFTGDANLEYFSGATKINTYNNSWYDETTQSIFASTDAGLLVFGSRNTYLYRDWKNVTNCQFTKDGTTHITNNGITTDLKYYKEEGYGVKPIEFETSFYGVGSTETISIDRWAITLYDLEGESKPSYIKVGVRSINDITVKSEEKTYKITPDMYDKWSHSVLINYNPKLIKGQGLKLYVEAPLTVQRIVPHMMDDGYSTTTKHSM